MKKRMICLLLVMSMVLSVIPTAYASTVVASGSCGDNVTWNLDSDGLMTITGSGDMTNYTGGSNNPWEDYKSQITQLVIGEGITSVGGWSFTGCENLTRVQLPQTLTKIQMDAFSECGAIQEISIPASVTLIGNGAFFNCTQLQAVHITDLAAWCNIDFGDWYANPLYWSHVLLLNGEPVTEVAFPVGTTEVKPNLFIHCDSLTEVRIPQGVTVIGDSAFMSCEYLESASLPYGLTTIEGFAFFRCNVLQDVALPQTLTSIGQSAFSDCYGITEIVIPEGVTTIEQNTFSNCTNLKKAVIPDCVTWIGYHGFYNTGIEELDLPEDLRYVGEEAFSHCDKLTSLKIPDSVTTMATKAFRYMNRIRIVHIPQGITAIPTNAFESCDALEIVQIPASVTSIGASAFLNCNQLTDIYYFGTQAQWNAITIGTGNTALTGATIHYECDQWQDLVEMGFSLEALLSQPNIVITPVSEQDMDTALTDVVMTSALGEVTVTGRYPIALEVASRQDIVLQKDGYRDYILPAEVAQSFCLSPGIGDGYIQYPFTAVMQQDHKDGLPYISTVFVREHGTNSTFVDARATEYYAAMDVTYDLIVSAAGLEGKSVTYYIGQNQQSRISSVTGVFTAQQLSDVFSYGKKIYAYAIADDGTCTEPVELKLTMFMADDYAYAFLSGSTFSLFGDDGMALKVAEDFPILGGLSMGLDAFSAPIGVDITGNKIKVSIGLDLFSTSKTDDQKAQKEYIWKDFKKQFQSIQGNISDSKEALTRFRELRNRFTGKRIFDTESKGFDLELMGYLEGEVINGEVVFTEALVTLGGTFKASSTRYIMLGWIPVYVAGGFEGEISVTADEARIVADESVPVDFGISLDVNPKLWLEGGAGIRNVASLSVFGEGSAPYHVNFSDKYHKWMLKGELGLKARLFLWSAKYTLLKGEKVLIDEYYGSPAAMMALYGEDLSVPEAQTQMVSREYADSTSQWLGETPANVLSAQTAGTEFGLLQSGIFSETGTQLAVVGDRLVMVWTEDDLTRDDYNRMRLVYSVYDAASDTWSQPKAVYDDGCNDGNVSLAVCGDKLVIAWQKLSAVMTEADFSTATALLENAEIYVAVYDPALDCVSDVQRITQNTSFDYLPIAASVGGQAAVYYICCQDNDLTGTGNNTLYRWTAEEGSVALAQQLDYVLTVDASGDQAAWCENGAAYRYAGGTVSRLDDSQLWDSIRAVAYGQNTLYVSDGANIYSVQGASLTAVLPAARQIGANLTAVETDSGTVLLWLETTDTGNELFTASCVGGVWTDAVQISDQGYTLSFMDAVYYGEQLMGVCNMTFEDEEAALMRFTVNGIADVKLDDWFYFDERLAVPGEDMALELLLTNNGTEHLEALTFTLTDTLGTGYTVTQAVSILSGNTETVTVYYPVPADYAPTTLTITVSIPEAQEADTSDNTASVAIGGTDLSLSEISQSMGDNAYLVTVLAENVSHLAAENVTVALSMDSADSQIIRTVSLGTLSGGSCATVRILLESIALNFDDDGVARVYLTVSGDTTEHQDSDNTVCVLIRKNTASCDHPVLETGSTVAPGCVTQGYTLQVCTACGESVKTDVQAALGHRYTYAVTAKPTDVSTGVLTASCSCGSEIAVELPALSPDSYTYTVITEPSYTEDGLGRYIWKQTAYGEICIDVVLPDLTADVETLELAAYPVKVFYSIGEELDLSGLAVRAIREDGEVELLSEGFTVTGFDSQTLGKKTVTVSCEGVSIDLTLAVVGQEDLYGQCGDTAYWLVENAASTLTVFGLGDMYDLASTNDQPWYSARGNIVHIVVADGIESIGSYAFSYAYCAEDVTLGSSIAKVGTYAFYSSTVLARITMLDKLGTVEYGAFSNCAALEEVHVSSLESWCANTFKSSSSTPLYYAQSLYVQGVAVTELVIPDGITAIGDYQFYGLNDLTGVTIGKDVQEIGAYAFFLCESLTQADLGENVVRIGNYAFMHCTSLETVRLPETLESIGYYGFSSCPALKNIAMPDSLTSIESYAFKSSGITELTIPKHVTEIGENAFASCVSLQRVYAQCGDAEIGKDAFVGCSALNGVYISDLESWCGIYFTNLQANPLYFAGNLYLDGELVTQLVLPDALSDLNAYAFAGCTSLTELTLPDAMTTVAMYSFAGCTGLVTLTIPDNVTLIGTGAFKDCTQIICVTIPESVTSIYAAAFMNWDRIHHVLYKGTEEQFDDIYVDHSNYDMTSATIHYEADGTEVIRHNTCSVDFWYCSVNEGYFRTTYKNPVEHVFENGVCGLCGVKEGLQYTIHGNGTVVITGYTGTDSSLTVPAEIEGFPVESIMSFAFWDCTVLTELTISHGVGSIGEGAFSGCSNLQSLTIPFVGYSPSDLVQYPIIFMFGADPYSGGIPTTQFYYDHQGSMRSFSGYFPESLKSVTVTGGTIAAGAFQNCTDLTQIHLECDTASIGENAFSGCSSLTELVLPESVAEIGAYAFNGCTGLESMTLPAGVTELPEGLFENCSSLKHVAFSENVTKIGNYAFSGCSALESIALPDGITQIPAYAFYNCTSLQSVDIPEGVTAIREYAFTFCSSLEEAVLPGSLESIGPAAFGECSSLQEIIIPEGVTAIDYQAFYGCTSAHTVTIPDSVTGIGNYAFYKCDSVTALTIPGSVTSLGTYTFSKCGGLVSVRVEDGVRSIPSNTFDGCSNLVYIVLPDSVTDVGTYAFSGCGSMNHVLYTGTLEQRLEMTIDDVYSSLRSSTWHYEASADEITVKESCSVASVYCTVCEAYIGAYNKREPAHVFDDGSCTLCGVSQDWEYTVSSDGTATVTGYHGTAAEVSVPDTLEGYPVTVIGSNAFADNTAVTSVTLPAGITTIEYSAFYGCTGLSSITVPEGVTHIGDSAFSGCKALEQLTLPYSLTGIGYSAFAYCESLTAVTIPQNVTDLGSYAFRDCINLRTLSFPADAPGFGTNAFFNVTASVHYPCDNATWEDAVLQSYGGNITWVPGHSYTSQTTPPGHLEDGFTTHTCSLCGDSYVDTVVQAPGHTEVTDEAVEASCTETGLTEGSHCGVCGEILVAQQIVPTVEHSWDEGTVTLAPTEENNGICVYACAVCGETREDVIPELEHVHTYVPAVTAPTCTEKGYTTHTCRCGDSYTDSYVEALGHSYEQVRTEPGCTEQGYTTNTCPICGDSFTSDITEAAGHSWDEGVIVTEPTETTEGVRRFTCAACGETREEAVPVLEHTHRYSAAVTPPTCTDAGYTTYRCRCGDSYTDDITPAKGHRHDAVITLPSCTNNGYTTYTCHCGDSYVSDYVEAVGHIYGELVEIVAPGCETDGMAHHCCANCTAYQEVRLSATGHSFGDWLETKAPNALQDGELTRTCSVCSTAQTQPIENNPFVDVPESRYYYNAVMWAYYNDVTSGKTDIEFQPDGECTRAQVVTFLWRAAGKPEPENMKNEFSDVYAGKYYYQAVLWAVENGITYGYSDGTFRPDDTCTRAQIVAFLYRYAGNPPVEDAPQVDYSDAQPGKYYYNAVVWANANEVVFGYSDGTFRPNAICTRAQIVAFLYRYLGDEA